MSISVKTTYFSFRLAFFPILLNKVENKALILRLLNIMMLGTTRIYADIIVTTTSCLIVYIGLKF